MHTYMLFWRICLYNPLQFIPVKPSVQLYSDRKPCACQKLGDGPGVGKCPAPRQCKICQCPTPRTYKVGKCPAVARGGVGLGTGVIDWCIKPFSIANYWALLHIFSPTLLQNFHLLPFSLHVPLRPSIPTRFIYEKHHQKKNFFKKLFFRGSNSYLNRVISMIAVLFVSNIKLPVCNKSVKSVHFADDI